MCWYWIIPLPWCVWHRYTQRGERHVKTEAEDGVMHLKTKECRRPPANRQSQSGGLEQILPHSLKGPTLLQLDLGLPASTAVRKKCLLFVTRPVSGTLWKVPAWADWDSDDLMGFGFCYEWYRREHYGVLSRRGPWSEWHFKQISLALVLIKTTGRGGKE